MIHARDDYNRMQDPAGKIPADEPVLLFRAQDKHTAMVARFYRELLQSDPETTPGMLESIEAHIPRIDAWPVKKTPDLPR